MPTAQELILRGQQYRNYEPQEFWDALDNSGEAETRDALHSIEADRFWPLLEAVSDMFFKLDNDERDLFTDRNPGLVEWMSVWNAANGLNPYRRWRERAEGILSAEFEPVSRVGMPDRDYDMQVPGQGYAPPPFERRSMAWDTLMEDMLRRRRSYRNWSPFEFADIATHDPFTVSRGRARQLDLFDPEVMEELEFPLEGINPKLVARKLMQRVEAGRFEPIPNACNIFFKKLDPDEATLFAFRNRGVVTWTGIWGYMEDVDSWPPRLLDLTQLEWPPLSEVGNGPTDLSDAEIARRRKERNG